MEVTVGLRIIRPPGGHKAGPVPEIVSQSRSQDCLDRPGSADPPFIGESRKGSQLQGGHLISECARAGIEVKGGPVASNLLISSLPDDLREIVTSELETIKLEIKSYMMRPGQSITHVYFPTTGMISVVVALENGGTVETLTIAHEGFCGIPLLLGQQIATRDAFVQIAGEFQRMDSEVFLALLRDHPEMRDSLQAYANYALTVAEQSAACLAYHSLDSRLARWLLTVSDRFPGDELQLTQEFLGQMLGVYRPSVTLAMGLLQETGLIAHRRGVVRIIDRQRLEDAACECYRVTRRWPGIPN